VVFFLFSLLFRKPRLTAMGIRCADHVTPSTRKSQHYFADSGGRSVGIVRLRTKAKEFFMASELQLLLLPELTTMYHFL
jgi:hypothetical protein